MTGFSHKTLENSLLKVLQSSGTVPTHFPYPVWKFSRQIVQIFSGIITNMDESGLPIFDWIPAVVIWHDRLLPAKCWPLLHVIAGISARSLRFEGNKIHCSPRDQSLSVNCYTSQLQYVFWLEEKVSRAVGPNSLTPWETTWTFDSRVTRSWSLKPRQIHGPSWGNKTYCFPWGQSLSQAFLCRVLPPPTLQVRKACYSGYCCLRVSRQLLWHWNVLMGG